MTLVIQVCTQIFAALLAVPAIRTFLEDTVEGVAAKIFADIFTRTNTDPIFKTKYIALSNQLAAATTPEDKQNVLIQMRALRSAPTTPTS